MEPVRPCTIADAHSGSEDDDILRRLLWDEYPHVKRCVKRTLEDNMSRREQAYPVALQRALELYRSERMHRAVMGESLAQHLDALGKASGAYPCPVSATLFTANYDVQSLLVSQDPLVKRAEEFLRQTIELAAQEGRSHCRFDMVLAAYLDFASQHRDRIVAVSPQSSLDGSSAKRKLPLGLQPYTARMAGVPVAFPTAAAWAAFVANKTLWQRLAGAPTFSPPTPVPAPAPAHAPEPPRFARGTRMAFRRSAPCDDKWATVREHPRPTPLGPRAVFVLAPDVDEWERCH